MHVIIRLIFMFVIVLVLTCCVLERYRLTLAAVASTNYMTR